MRVRSAVRAIAAATVPLVLCPAFASAQEWTSPVPFAPDPAIWGDGRQFAVTGERTLVAGGEGKVFRKAPGATTFDAGVDVVPGDATGRTATPAVLGGDDGSVVAWWYDSLEGIRTGAVDPMGAVGPIDWIQPGRDPENALGNRARSARAVAASSGATVLISFPNDMSSGGPARVAVRLPGERVGPVLEIERDFRRVPAIAINDAGRAVAAWRDGLAVYDPVARAWSRPARPEAPRGSMTQPAAAVNQEGDALVAWPDESTGQVFEHLEAGATTTTVRVLGPEAGLDPFDTPVIAVEPDGTLTVVARRREPPAAQSAAGVWSLRPDGSWATSVSAEFAFQPVIRAGAEGDVVIAWQDAERRAYAQVRRPGRGFGPVQALGGSQAGGFEIAIDEGEAVVARVPYCDDGAVTLHRLARDRSTFSPAQVLEAGGPADPCDSFRVRKVDAAMHAGYGGVAWIRRDGAVAAATVAPGEDDATLTRVSGDEPPVTDAFPGVTLQMARGGDAAVYFLAEPGRRVAVRAGSTPVALGQRDTSGPPMSPLDVPSRAVALARRGSQAVLTCHRASCAGVLLVYRARGPWFPSRTVAYALRRGQSRAYEIGTAQRVIALDTGLRTVATLP